MAFTALQIITDAYERCNRLSPGEPLSADDAAFGLRRLNLLQDEMSARGSFLYRSVLTSAAQTGHITLAAGSWAAIGLGDEIVSATADGVLLAPLTMQQYAALYDKTTSGMPSIYAHDGASTVYLWPVANGQTIQLLTRVGVSEFADLTTSYTAPDGYRAALGAGLAVRIAPTLLGAVPPSLLRAEAKCMAAIDKYQPAIVDVGSYASGGCRSHVITDTP